jgi:hypothetical protein
MAMNLGEFRRRAGRMAVLLLAGTVVAAGTVPSDAATLIQRLFGGGKSNASNTPSNALVVNPDDLNSDGGYCPEVRIIGGGVTYATFDPNHDGDQSYVRYLGSINQTARECTSVTDAGISMKVGVAGRVIAGPKGLPGKLTLPLRVTVVKQTTNTVLFNKTYSATVTVSPGGDLTADFSQVIDPVTFKRTALDQDLIVYVGFDPKKTAGSNNQSG